MTPRRRPQRRRYMRPWCPQIAKHLDRFLAGEPAPKAVKVVAGRRAATITAETAKGTLFARLRRVGAADAWNVVESGMRVSLKWRPPV